MNNWEKIQNELRDATGIEWFYREETKDYAGKDQHSWQALVGTTQGNIELWAKSYLEDPTKLVDLRISDAMIFLKGIKERDKQYAPLLFFYPAIKKQ